MTASIQLQADVDAPVEDVWDAATDWARQGEWMFRTSVRPTRYRGNGVGGELSAWTGVGRLGFRDTMRITRWEPPHRCDVEHTGRIVRGPGVFEVRPRPGGSVFLWREDLELPLGALGRAGWPLVRPFFVAGVRYSLRRFARWVERGRPSPTGEHR